MEINVYRMQLDILENKISRVRKFKALIENAESGGLFEISSNYTKLTIAGTEIKEKLQELLKKEVQEYKKHLHELNNTKIDSELEE